MTDEIRFQIRQHNGWTACMCRQCRPSFKAMRQIHIRRARHVLKQQIRKEVDGYHQEHAVHRAGQAGA